MILRKHMEDESAFQVPDRKVINMNEYYEIEYWASKFEVSPEQLKLAVQHTGSIIPAEIEEYLAGR
ncbi:DUF3606 domain-containing protein [Pedobacter antarcticus]|nr:DUF3606 domain-containing protein [Pedobacter antarcticus]SDL49651.1 Protein of unknown function [Pedobacter antarcticus]SFE35705.1 Protein of unknown function [Pedobacter antarcticus]